MSAPSKKTYVGSYGVFLDTVNQPETPLKPVVIDVLKQNNGHMGMKALIMSVDAPTVDLMDTINTLQNQHVIRVTRQNNDEFVDVI